jgi:hypothetical protein
MTLKKILINAIGILAFAAAAQSQDLKPLDYAKLYARNKVSIRVCKEVKYEMNKAVDSTMVGIAMFDKNGRMIQYTEFFAGGKKMAEYEYYYDESGKMVKSTVSLIFNNWVPLEFSLKYDSKGRVVARELREQVANYWKKETYTYANDVMIKSEQFYDVNGGLVALTHKDYSPNLEVSDNSLTYIVNEKGLIILHQNMNNRGKVDKALVYEYYY